MRFVFRHAVRFTAKSILIITVAIFFVIALGWLRGTVVRTEEQIERLYDTIIVDAEVQPVSGVAFMRNIGELIDKHTVSGILETGMIREEYLVAGHTLSMVIPVDSNGDFPENWQEIADFDEEVEVFRNHDSFNHLLAFSDMERFVSLNSADYLPDIMGFYRFLPDGSLLENFHIEFAIGFDKYSFVFTQGQVIPIILSETTMRQRGVEVGDTVFIKYSRTIDYADVAPWEYLTAVVIGVHNRNILGVGLQDAVIIPLAAMEYILSEEIGYITFTFEIEPSYAADLDAVKLELERIAGTASWVELELVMHDDELRNVVGSMEQTLSLLRLLYPVAIAISIIIGAGLSLLLMLQNAKNAAIMRVLGSTKNRTRAVLWIEQLAVCLIGLIIGLAAVFILDWGALVSVMLAGLYLVGVVIGSVVGSVLVTSKPPLELLQVKE